MEWEAEIGGDLLDGRTVIATAGDSDVVAELVRVSPERTYILLARPPGQAKLSWRTLVHQTRALELSDPDLLLDSPESAVRL